MKIKMFITVGLLLFLAVCINGCASLGDNNTEPGVLTITNIPAEFEGKYVSFTLDMGANYKPKIIASATDPRGFRGRHTAAVIKDGTATLMLFEDKNKLFGGLEAFTGTVTVPVELCIRNTPETIYSGLGSTNFMPDFIFDQVIFENGIANIEWINPFIPGIITITDIPDQYNDPYINIAIGLSELNLTTRHFLAGGTGMANNVILVSGNIKDGMVITKIYRESRDKYMTYNFTGTLDIIIAIPNGMRSSLITIGIDPTYDYFLFRGVQVTNGRISINFNQGTKQNQRY